MSCSWMAAAQEAGIIAGKVINKGANNEPLPFATVFAQGTQKGTNTDFDGFFRIDGISPGTYTIEVRFVGYETLTLPNIVVEAGKVTETTAAMSAGAKSLEDVVVMANTEKDSDIAMIMLQRESLQMLQSIGGKELSRKGVGDAEGAVTKITGVSKQQGVKNVFVRGLGDRYNSTSLNNLPLPSEDPEYKNIALSFFTSDIINSIDVNKAFGAQLYGDVAGANINITSKELGNEDIFQIGISSGINTQTISEDFYSASGTSKFGTVKNPASPITDLNKYDFKNSFEPTNARTPIHFGLSLNAGKKFQVRANTLNTFLVASHSADFTYQNGVTRDITPEGGRSKDLTFDKYEYHVSQLLMGNLKYEMGENNFISYIGSYLHDNKQSVGNYNGFHASIYDDTSNPGAQKSFIRRQQENNNRLYVNQLLSYFEWNKSVSLDLGASYNVIEGNEPDRRTNSYAFNSNKYQTVSGSAAANHRFFSELEEKDYAARALLTVKMNSEESLHQFQFGGNYRNTKRDFSAMQFNFNFDAPTDVDRDNPDGLFNQQSLDNGLFNILTANGNGVDAFVPITYNGDREIFAGLVNYAREFNSALLLNFGLRYEQIKQDVIWDTNLDRNTFNNNINTVSESYLLPSLNLKYNLTNDKVVRLAASKTYTLPQFKEVAPFLYEDVNFSSFGNSHLKPSNNYNLDLKYDRYFNNTAMISVTGFFKRVEDALNRVQVNSAANELSYVNTGNANVTGIELEFKESLIQQYGDDNSMKLLNFGLNVSYLYSNQKLVDVPSDALTVRFTNAEDKLEGASPLLINADLTYQVEREGLDFTSSLVMNYFSDRVFSLGTAGSQNIMEKGLPTLDFITKAKLGEHLGLSLSLKNLLNPAFKLTNALNSGRETLINSYKRGMNVSFGINYTF
ncbi:TonB-dependent receptor domain-containing protein [Roseivirga echinicomitans]